MGDFKSLQILVESTKKSKVIFALPQNYTFYFDASRYPKGYNRYFILKDKIENLKSILSNILPKHLKTSSAYNYNLAFENSETTCSNSTFESAFYFSEFPYTSIITKANDSDKATTIKASFNCILTTLNLGDSDCSLKDFLIAIGAERLTKTDIPLWLNEVRILDDKMQQKTIETNEHKIFELQKEINRANEKLNKNLYYKSVLTETGDNLVEIVFDMLGKFLNYDLSEFVDKKKEDFQIKLKDVTFIGEIKGINTNVKSSNISQVENHCRIYEDDLNETKENVKGLLVINTFRDKKLEEREAVHIDSINLAKKYGVLIITTIKLLKLFEKFALKEITSEQIIEAFKNQIGLIDLDKIK